jgi:hypothetical protein
MLPDDRRHGTEAGCREHYRQGTKPCPPCLNAHRIANNLRELYPSKTSALGSQRRIQALQALGYGRHRIAVELGYNNGGALTYLMQADTLLVVTATRIREVYDRLSMTIPQGVGPTRARTWARRHGHAPPLAWDDIDNPDEQPKGMSSRPGRNPDDVDPVIVERLLLGERVPSTRAEKEEAMRRWLADGKSAASLCRAHGWQDGRYIPREDVAS